MSEMDWTNKNIHPSRLVEVGQEVEVMVLDVDESRRRVSLGMKQCQMNPWEAFSQQHTLGEKVTGTVRSVTDFGVFVGLDGGIDGLIHVSDLSWAKPTESDLQSFQKGDQMEAVILSIDADRERISLGVKQMTDDPSQTYIDAHDKGEVVKATVKAVEDKSANLELEDEVAGQLHISEYSHEHINSLRDVLNPGDVIDVRIIGKDEKSSSIILSRKATLAAPEKPRVAPQANVKRTLGDLLKEQMDSDDASDKDDKSGKGD